LVVKETKSQVAAVSRCVFLGFVVSGRRVKICAAAKTGFKKRIRELTNRSRGISFSRALPVERPISRSADSRSSQRLWSR
jgi:hypothetical protein